MLGILLDNINASQELGASKTDSLVDITLLRSGLVKCKLRALRRGITYPVRDDLGSCLAKLIPIRPVL